MRTTEKDKRKDTTFTMRMPSEIHSFLEKHSYKNYTSMSNVIIQLLIKLREQEND